MCFVKLFFTLKPSNILVNHLCTTGGYVCTPWEQCFKANNDILSCLYIQICFGTLIIQKFIVHGNYHR